MKNDEVKEKKNTTKKATNTTKKNKTSETKKENIEKIKKETVVEKETPKAKTTVRKNKKMKSSDIILILGVVIVVALGWLVMGTEKPEPTYELPLVLSGEPGLHQLTYAEYQQKVNNDESFVLIIERATCSYCVEYMPIAESFALDSNVPIYYVDTDTFSSEDWEGFETSNTFLKKNNGKWGTPTTVVLAGKDAVDSIEGLTTSDALLELYNEYFEMPQ